jgi:signal transduction histidine kinase
LATLRYRLQRRLEVAAIEIVWSVEELPAIDGLGPTKVLQIQRLLLEVFTNIIKHSKANRIEVGASLRKTPSEELVLRVADNGVGFNMHTFANRPNGDLGHGLRNMQARADAIGATLLIESKVGIGTTISLIFALNQ